MAAMEGTAEPPAAEERAIGLNTYAAHQLAHFRLERELTGFRGSLEAILRTNEMRECLETRSHERQEYLRAVQLERSQELDRRIFEPLRQRQSFAQAERDRIQDGVESELSHKEQLEERRQRNFEAYRSEATNTRLARAEDRANHLMLTAARAEALHAGRIAEELRRQEELETRRAEACARLAQMRAQSMDAKRRRNEEMALQLQAHQQEEQARIWDKALNYDDKIDRVSRMEEKRSDLTREIAVARERAHQTRMRVQQLLHEATGARAEDSDELRARLEDLVATAMTSTLSGSTVSAKRPGSSPTTPRMHRSFFEEGSGRSPSFAASPRVARPATATASAAAASRGRRSSSGMRTATPVQLRTRSANRTATGRQASTPATLRQARRSQQSMELSPDHRRLLPAGAAGGVATPAKPGGFEDAAVVSQGSDAPTEAGTASLASTFASMPGVSPSSSPLGRSPAAATAAAPMGPQAMLQAMPQAMPQAMSLAPQAMPQAPPQVPPLPQHGVFHMSPSSAPGPTLAPAAAAPSPASLVIPVAAAVTPRMAASPVSTPTATAWPASPTRVQVVKVVQSPAGRSSTPISPQRARAVVGAGVSDVLRGPPSVGGSSTGSPVAAQSPVSVAAAAIRSAAFAMRP